MAKKTDYTIDNIQVLNDREHVRLRTSVYLGNTSLCEYTIPLFEQDTINLKRVNFVPAVYKAIGEIIDNSIDELVHLNSTTKQITIQADPSNGEYTISDNGRGVPIDKHHEVGKRGPEVVFGHLRSGRNFSNDRVAGVQGQNGVGSACTNYCSTKFSVDINHNGQRYSQTFTNGGESVSNPSIRKGGKQTGTSISFKLDPEIFEKVSIDDQLIRNRAKEIAFTNPGLTVDYNGEKFKYKKGVEDILKSITSDYYKFEYQGNQIFVIFDIHEGIDEQMFTWVNSSFLFDGGICNTQFLNAFYDNVISHTKREAKKQKCEVTKNDVKKNLLVIGNLRISNPEYDSQAKTRLTGPNLRKQFSEMVTENWNSFSRKHKQWLQTVVDRAAERHHRQANSTAAKKLKKNIGKRIPGLIDATSKNRFECQLIVTEGDSAAGMIADAREPSTTASLPLRGKINNVHGSTIAQLLKMEKVTDLLSAIGLVPGERAIRSNLRYQRVVIATDADHDGSDIMTLLVNLFFTFWPELFDPNYEPFFYRLVAPNVCASKNKNRVHFPTRGEYEHQKEKYRNWKIKYMKGLGSMILADWEKILSGETDTLLPIQDDDGKMSETLDLLFGPSSESRKQWLQND